MVGRIKGSGPIGNKSMICIRLDKAMKIKKIDKVINSPKHLPVIGKYIDKTKYNIKNVTKYLNEKKEMYKIPFNTLFYEATEEANVADLFLKLKNVKDETDENYIFMENVLNLTDKIIKILQELQMKMR